MAKFYVDYLTKDGDLCHVWVNAYDTNDAKYQARNEYWDIDSIVGVRKA